MTYQALEGKDIKDMLVNVGSGGGAAAPAAGGAAAAAGGDAAPAEEAKEEGTSHALRKNTNLHMIFSEHPVPPLLTSSHPAIENKTGLLTTLQRRRSPTRIWVSVSSTKGIVTWPVFSSIFFHVLSLHGWLRGPQSIDIARWRDGVCYRVLPRLWDRGDTRCI